MASETISQTRGGNTAAPFDPRPHIIRLQDGKEYLPVVDRIQWLRAEHPEASITTQLLHFDWEAGWFIFKARVEVPGLGVAEGTGSETRGAFPKGPCEKAETVAIGRALAALGFGTAFAVADFEEGHLADAPVETPTNGTNGTAPTNGHQPPRDREAMIGNRSTSLATPAQLKLIYLCGTRDAHLDEQELEEQCHRQYGRLPLHLTKQEASQFIDALKAVGSAVGKRD